MLAAVDSGAYKALLSIHILMAIAWIGGGLFLTLQAERARHLSNDEEYVKVAISAEFWATRFFVPASLVLVGCGFGLVGVGHLGFSKPFIDVGISVWGLSFLLGAGFLGPQGGKVKALMADGSAITQPILDRVNRILMVARIDLVLLLGVVVVMVVKPGGGV